MKPRDYFVRHEPGTDRVSLDEARRASRLPVYGVLDRIRSAHNVGSIFRTADGVNAAGLWLAGYTPVPPHRHLAKTALGAVEVVPWRHCDHAIEAIEELRAEVPLVLGLEHTATSTSLYATEVRFPVVLVVGNEVDGLDEAVQAQCERVVHLPMHGHKNSLNVSVAFGVAMYELLRRYTAGSAGAGSATL